MFNRNECIVYNYYISYIILNIFHCVQYIAEAYITLNAINSFLYINVQYE